MFRKIKSLLFAKNNEHSANIRIVKKLHNMHIKYISEKTDDGTDIIIGRNGHINIIGEKGEELCATCGIKTIFRLNINEMNAWEFMSLDGCVITFTDLDTNTKRTVTVYYDMHLT